MRNLTLDRPLVAFDLETTGTDTERDRIVEIALIRVEPLGLRREFATRVNPGVPIPPEATRVHGISDADVAGAPRFAEIAAEVVALLEGADLAGFNTGRFDLPLLLREFERAGVQLDLAGRRHVDACRIFHQRERRDLTAAVAFYTGQSHAGAHSALADARATLEVLDGQFDRYPDLPRDLNALHKISNPDEGRFIDRTRKFGWNEAGEPAIAFGRHRWRSLRELAQIDPGYLEWIARSADFANDARQIASEALAGRFPPRRTADRASETASPGTPGT